MLHFQNTRIAFASKSNLQLRKSQLLFSLVAKSWVVRFSKRVINFFNAIRFPIGWFVKPTIFEIFCGGETIEESDQRIVELDKYHIGSILDYSVEGSHSDKNADKVVRVIIQTIEKARNNEAIPFAVFKVTGIASDKILERRSWHKEEMSSDEQEEWMKVVLRMEAIAKTAHEYNVPLFVDAEDYAFQPAIDELTWEMMTRFNREKAIVFNTIQAYRKDRFHYLKEMHALSKKEGVKYGVKLVRGAYMEKERERAIKGNYPSPIHETKKDTDQCFNDCLRYIVDHIEDFSLCNGTHNEESNYLLADLMKEKGIEKSDPRIYNAQLLGMSDHISYNLAHEGYNVAKYVPFGPVREVMPYLIRRAEENSSAKGQTGRELMLIKRELSERKQQHRSAIVEPNYTSENDPSIALKQHNQHFVEGE